MGAHVLWKSLPIPEIAFIKCVLGKCATFSMCNFYEMNNFPHSNELKNRLQMKTGATKLSFEVKFEEFQRAWASLVLPSLFWCWWVDNLRSFMWRVIHINVSMQLVYMNVSRTVHQQDMLCDLNCRRNSVVNAPPLSETTVCSTPWAMNSWLRTVMETDDITSGVNDFF